jgi:hypothetical protein
MFSGCTHGQSEITTHKWEVSSHGISHIVHQIIRQVSLKMLGASFQEIISKGRSNMH